MRFLMLLLVGAALFGAEDKVAARLRILDLAGPDRPAALADLPSLEKVARARPVTMDLPVRVFRLGNLDFLGAGRKEQLDVYLPNDGGRKDRPAVLFIHGGGFTGGDKAEYRSASVSADLARAGYLVVSCNYVLGAKATPGVWPRNIADCREAVRWMRAHAAELGINPDKIAVAGGSAGGYLALMVGLSDDRFGPGGDPAAKLSARVSAVIDMYGVTDFSKHGKGAVPGADAEAERLLIPANNVDVKDPPVLVLHGTADTTVDLAQSLAIVEALRKGRVNHELIVVDGAPHTFDLHPKGRGWTRTERRYSADGEEAEDVTRSADPGLTEAVVGFLSKTIGR